MRRPPDFYEHKYRISPNSPRLVRIPKIRTGKNASPRTPKSEYIPPLAAIFYRRDGIVSKCPLFPVKTSCFRAFRATPRNRPS
jgi:hypothetical protein